VLQAKLVRTGKTELTVLTGQLAQLDPLDRRVSLVRPDLRAQLVQWVQQEQLVLQVLLAQPPQLSVQQEQSVLQVSQVRLVLRDHKVHKV
jgi:hypothetical protein